MISSVLALSPLAKIRGRVRTGRDAARPIIAGILGVETGELRFSEGPYGKPGLRQPRGVNIALSHSGGLLAVYVGPSEAGVDIERIRPRNDLPGLARTIFSPPEAARILDCEDRGESSMLLRFYLAWTVREARIKRLGLTVWDFRAADSEDAPRCENWLARFRGEAYAISLCAAPEPPELLFLSPDITAERWP